MMRLLYPLLFLKVTITHGTDIIRNRHFADDSGRTESRPQAFLQESNANRRSFENVRSFTSVDAVDGRVLTFDGNEMVASKADFTIQYNNSEANKEIELYQKFLDTDNFMLHDELEKDVHEAFGINVMENNDAKVDKEHQEFLDAETLMLYPEVLNNNTIKMYGIEDVNNLGSHSNPNRPLANLGEFQPLLCNANLATAKCTGKVSNVIPANGVLRTPLTIPCGQCWKFDVEKVNLVGGINIIGKLLFPLNQKARIVTTSVIVQGELKMIVNHPVISPENLAVEFILRGTQDIMFTRAGGPGKDICNTQPNQKCNFGKKPFVVAGGKIDVRANAPAPCKTFTKIKDKVFKSPPAKDPDDFIFYKELPAECPKSGLLFYKENFNGNTGNWTGHKGGQIHYDGDKNGKGAIRVSNRKFWWQGPYFDYTMTSPEKCLVPDTEYLFSARIKLDKADGSDDGMPTSCVTNSRQCPRLVSDIIIAPSGRSHYRAKFYLKPRAAGNYGEWVDFTGIVTFSADEVFPEDGEIGYAAFLIENVDPGVDISLDSVLFHLPSESTFPDPDDLCGNLVFNGDAESNLNSPYPMSSSRSDEMMTVEKEKGNKFFRLANRRYHHSGIQFELDTACLDRGVTYFASFKVRIHSEFAEQSHYWYFEGTKADGARLYRRFLNCPGQVTSDDWVTCSGEFLVDSAMAEAQKIYVRMALDWREGLFTIDYDDLSMHYLRGYVDELVVDADDTSCWGENTDIHITSSIFYTWYTMNMNGYEGSIKNIVVKSDGTHILLNDITEEPIITMLENAEYAAEIVLLTRNVKITGATDEEDETKGGYMQVLHTPHIAQRISGLEFINMGRLLETDRFPIQILYSGSIKGSVISWNSIRKSNQRGIALEGTSNVTIAENIGHKVTGHCMYVGFSSQDNKLIDNLVSETVGTHRHQQLWGENDANAAAFNNWYQPNDYIGNIAVATRKSGFRLYQHHTIRAENGTTLPHSVTGYPRTHSTGVFEGNVAKSSGDHGIVIEHHESPHDITFGDCKAMRNRFHGVYMYNMRHVFVSGIFAENQFGLEMRWSDDVTIFNSTFIGLSNLTKANTSPAYYYERCDGHSHLPPKGYRMQTQIFRWNLYQGEARNRGALLSNVTFSDFDLDGKCQEAVPITFNTHDKRNLHWNYVSAFDKVSFEGARMTDAEAAEEVGFTTLFITDIEGSSDPSGKATNDSSFVLNNEVNKKFAYGKCTNYGGLSYCEDMCLRTVTYTVDQSGTRDWTLFVKRVEDGVENYIGHNYQYDDDVHESQYDERYRQFKVNLPLGAYDAHFRNGYNDDVQWPRFVRESWDGVPACTGYANTTNVNMIEPEGNCDNLVLNGDFEEGYDFWQRRDKGELRVLMGAGMDGSIAVGIFERGHRYQAMGQNMDTRCLHQNKGKYYEIRAYIKLENENNGENVFCTPYDGNDETRCPHMTFKYRSYRNLERKEDEFTNYLQPFATVTQPYIKDEFNLVHGVFKVTQLLTDAQQIWFYIEHAYKDYAIIHDNISIQMLDSESLCNTDLVRNGNFSDGTSSYWYRNSGTTKLEIIETPEDGGHALKVYDRPNHNVFKYNIHASCLIEKERYAVKVRYKLEKVADGTSWPCDISASDGEFECMYINMYSRSEVTDARRYIRLANTVAVADDKRDGWDLASDIFTIEETHANNEELLVYTEGPHQNMNVIVMDMSIVPVPFDCSNLVLNPSFEDGSLSFWKPYDIKIDRGIISPGADNSQHASFLTGQHAHWTLLQNLDPRCFLDSQEYVITGKFKLLNETSHTFECSPSDKNARSRSHCPTVRVYSWNCDGANEDKMFWNDIPFFEWDKDKFNDFMAEFTVTGNWATCSNVRVEIGRYLPGGLKLLVDDFQISQKTTFSPSSGPTEMPTKLKQKVPSAAPTISTDAPTVNSISPPLVGDEPTLLRPGNVMITFAPLDTISTITKVVFDEHGDIITTLPIAMSYDMNVWEPAAGSFSSSLFNDDKIACYSAGCQIVLPYGTASAVMRPQSKKIRKEKYYLSSYTHAISKRNEYARFLESVTFGVTTSELDELEGINPTSEEPNSRIGKWIRDQMDANTVAPTLHRKFWRKRANPMLPASINFGHKDHPCEGPSKWRRYTFNRRDCCENEWHFRVLGEDPYVLNYRGQDRTVVAKSDFYVLDQAYIDANYTFNQTYKYTMCGNPSESIGGNIRIRLENGACVNAPNPVVNFSGYENLVSYALNLNSTGDLQPINEKWSFAQGFLSLDDLHDADCNVIPLENQEGFVFGQLPDGSWLQFEPRLQLATNTPMAPLPDGGKVAEFKTEKRTTCSNAPRTFLNQEQCVLSTNACLFSSSSSELTITLDSKTIYELYNLTGSYVNAIKGLAVVDQYDESVEHPCSQGGLRSRWKKKEISQCNPTPMFSGTNSSLTSLLRDTADPNEYIRDIYFPEMGKECNRTDFDVTEIQIIVDDDCWEHVHPDYMSVYDMTYWSTKHLGGAYNIKKWIQNGDVFLVYPTVHPYGSGSNHPTNRWEQNKHKFPQLGRFGDTIKLIDLSSVGLLTDEVVDYYSSSLGEDTSSVLVCGSPGEVENDRSLGHTFDVLGNDEIGHYDTTHNRKFVWLMIVLSSSDQLRQRVAWALCQILVVVKGAIGSQDGRTEWFLSYYDIFVRHAFGNYLDILKEISYNPLMAENLSYLQSKSSSYVWQTYRIKAYADENFAREIMQLFTIGITKLNLDGTPMLDDNGNEILAYTNEDIMSFSRAWTGFDLNPNRGNIEGGNRIDPMRIQASWRDMFPKTDLGGGYIGDTYPLCTDFPSKSFLMVGATYRFLGSSSLPELISDPVQFSTDETTVRAVLDDNSELRKALCNANAEGICQYSSIVKIEKQLECMGIECEVEDLRVVQISANAFFEYVRPPCVQQLFYNNAKKLSPRYRSWPVVCANPLLPVASEACCNQGSSRAYRHPKYDGERMTFAGSVDRCFKNSLTVCDFNDVVGHHIKNYNYFWTDDQCLLRIKVNPDGDVVIIHKPSSYTSKVLHINDDNENWFKVYWGDNGYPKAENDCDGICVTTPDGSCLCGTSVSNSRVFSGMPESISEAVSNLFIGALDPRIYYDGIYSPITDTNSNITAYLKDNRFDSDTIFEFTNKKGQKFLMKNLKETVQVRSLNGAFSGYTFRNMPQFMSFIPTEATIRDAQYETDAVLNHYFYNDNTAPFVSYRLIQRFVKSNPSPQFIHRVSIAFIEGSYTFNDVTYGTGKYGDLASTISAILLDREARNVVLDKDPTHGSLREPLLKFVSIMRSMDFVSNMPLIAVSSIERQIGQMTHEFGSVFSFFLPEFQPYGRVGDASLVAPEATLLDMPKIVGLLNGMFSLVKYGLYQNEGGFGWNWYNTKYPDAVGILEFNKTSTESSFYYETFEGRSLRGGLDHKWTGYNFISHIGQVVVDPLDESNHVISLESEHEFGGFIYKVRHNAMNWAQHEAAAVAWGGHLSSVHSYDEREFLMNIVNSGFSYYLGGRRKAHGNATDGSAFSWEWSDETKWNFTDWGKNEPNTLYEDRLHMYSHVAGKWNDIQGTRSYYAIYKKIKNIPTDAQGLLLYSRSEFISPTFTKDLNVLDSYVVKFRYFSLAGSSTGGCIGHTSDSSTYLNKFVFCDDGGSGPNSMTSQGDWIVCKFDVPEDISEFRIGLSDRSSGPSGFYFDDIQIVNDDSHGTGPTCSGVTLNDLAAPGIDGFSDAVIDELSTLLTAGRLDDDSKRLIRGAYDTADSHNEGVRDAQRLILTTAEFHSTNVVTRKNELREAFSFERPSDKPYKAVVTIMLNGGCDSWNMLVPYSCTKGKDLFEEYTFIRQAVAIPRQGLLPINATNQVCETFGIHANLPVIRDMYNDGDLLFFTNTGVLTQEVDKSNYRGLTKTQLFAHNHMQEESKRIDPNNRFSGTGFLGRMADALTKTGRKVGSFSVGRFHVALVGIPGLSDSPMIVNGNGIPLVFMSKGMSGTVKTLHNATKADSGFFAETWSDYLMQSLATNELLSRELQNLETTNVFPNSNLGNQLSTVSRLIASREKRGVDTDMFYVEIGGFDTHSSVEMRLNGLFTHINDAVDAFSTELKSMDLWNNVTTIQVSDFARTLNPNSGAGTDHAWGGNYIMFGGSVKGEQILGTYPDDLTDDGPLALTRGRMIPTKSWDACFLALGYWMGVQDGQIFDICPNCYQFPDSHFFDPDDLFDDVPPPAPTASPTTSEPTDGPTFAPSENPSISLKPSLSHMPSNIPTTSHPTKTPTQPPSKVPSHTPSMSPSSAPSSGPTVVPSLSPSNSPSFEPSISPSDKPSLRPSISFKPTASPTGSPVAKPKPVCVDNTKYKYVFRQGGQVKRKTCAQMRLQIARNRKFFCNKVDTRNKKRVWQFCRKGCLRCPN